MANFQTNPYKASYLAALRELDERKAELDFVTRRITQLEETIRSLEPLASDEVATTMGLSELCAEILRSVHGLGLTAYDVMTHLKYRGIDIESYSNPLAVIHTTLGRLCKPDSGFCKGFDTDGTPRYGYDESLVKREGGLQAVLRGYRPTPTLQSLLTQKKTGKLSDMK